MENVQPVSDSLVRARDLPWIPQGSANVWFKPLRINLRAGSWVNLLKVARSGVVNRHRHLSEVEGWVVQGRWHYLEHDWHAEPGAYVYEPPGDVHTLVADVTDAEPMLTLFAIHGPIEYVTETGDLAYVETAETKLKRYEDHCREHGIPLQPIVF
ncbi:2,4'-dihydroxyacetophenone dioxygenase family protein [Micromonospora globbae]|uniref:2,4'-dihydroxyacetophenone dioxygenase family protein n=1 Tax=Micromonospora globbae TaxID=1894969 RepID=A0ABZ1SBV2_9ACTN|nr:2,4'-dihydroxyacetophenone dioxygenase family protein [Micromonospora globbae]WTF83815.1 2,4'-dihydroxyacetophenone dioxygenase family protein [Micromonospora globbae]